MVTDIATATGGDERGEAKAGIGAGAGIDTDTQVGTGSALDVEAGIDTVTEGVHLSQGFSDCLLMGLMVRLEARDGRRHVVVQKPMDPGESL